MIFERSMFLDIEFHERKDGNFPSFFDGNYTTDLRGELYIFFTNPMHKFVGDLYKEFMEQFESCLSRQITFVPEIHAIKISTNSHENFDNLGIQEFVGYFKEYLDGRNKVEINGAFLYQEVANALQFFKLFNDRGIIQL